LTIILEKYGTHIMLTLSALQNTPSSRASPLKNSASATDVQEAGQAAPAAGFGEVLAHEMSGKDRSRTGLPDDKTAPGKAPDGRIVSAGEMEAQNAEIKKDMKERENNMVVVAAGLQPMDMTQILPGLAVARAPDSRTDAGIDARADVQANTQANTQADTHRSDPADILASMSPAELATAAAQHAGLVASQFSPVTAWPAGIPNSTGADTDTKAVAATADTDASWNARLSPDALTNVTAGTIARVSTRAGQGGVNDPVIADKTFVTDDDASIQPFQDVRQGILPRLESGSPKSTLASETRQLEKSMLEVAQHNSSAARLEAGAGAATAAPERSSISEALASASASVSASASAAAAGTPVHATPGLEPRLGAVGWDNALGQKVLWMVSSQQQVAELSLNPPDLGPLQVVLSITDDQVSAMFISQQADVRQALEAALPRLKEMMADSGINLSNTTVSADSSRQQAELEQQNHSGARYGKGNTQTTVQGIDTGANLIRSGENSLVDTFA
jgi:flagellar hook-length control protein FliK